MDISVVIPLFNEEESLPELYAWIERVMQANGFSFEVIFVNDGSTDHSWEVIEKLKAQSEHVKGIKFRRNYGKSPALYCGFAEAEGNVVITMDADLQDSPDEIPELYRMITKDGYDLVSGWKQKRYDPISKTLPTKLFNATARKDYLQVFKLVANGSNQQVTHTQEEPPYERIFTFPSDYPITAKIFVIDDETHTTMLLAEEY